MNRVPTSSGNTRSAGWLRALLPASEWDTRPNAELLDRFIRYAEQPAFEALLRRHGPLVWGVCRRILTNPPDMDDAFQATFLVLVQKAGSIAHGERIGPWLYGVAYRVAQQVREKAARIPTCDPEAAAMIPERPPHADPIDDWLPILDQELQALPAKYRDPLVLCELQGLTRKAAAERLRVREGTLSSRLARGRTLLRKRLLKHGTLLPAGGLAILLDSEGTVRGGVPAELLMRTAATLTGVVPDRVAKLANEVVKGMFLNKLRAAGGLVVALALAVVGLVAAAGPETKVEKPAEGLKEVANGPAANPGTAPGKPVIEGDLASIQGVWDGEQVLEGGSMPAEPIPWGRCIVVGNVAWMLAADDRHAYRWEVRLTSARNPKWIDLTTDGHSPILDEDVPGVVTHSIYRVAADGWEIAMPTGRGRLRPAEFATDDQVTAVRFRRAKAPQPGPNDPRRELEGRWTITRQAYPYDDRSAMVDRPVGTVEITSGHMFIQRPCDGTGKHFLWEAAAYTLDPTKDPKWIDLQFVSKKSREPAGYGVYELTGDTLRISYRLSVPRSLRTLEFKAGIEEPLVPTGVRVKPEDRKSACCLLELKRLGPP